LVNQNHDSEYRLRFAAEGKKWGDHLAIEATREMHAWLDHPTILAQYKRHGLIDELSWKQWVTRRLGGPAQRSLELGCGSGTQSVDLFQLGVSRAIEGLDASEDRIREAEDLRRSLKAPGQFRAADANQIQLEPGRYDLIFSCHSFHHFLELEHIMGQVSQALTPGGAFVLEEFVGPTQFQWTDQQIDVTRTLLSLIPERYRFFRWGAPKSIEGRPTVKEVVAASPFESIRSSEIFPLFQRYFRIAVRKDLGGTIQHLLYNGIIHNFQTSDPEAEACIRSVCAVESALIDGGLLPSDFMLLIGRKPRSATSNTPPDDVHPTTG
jgi:ubiquinone/menaquinone biosynthesis C-methylase UbiE